MRYKPVFPYFGGKSSIAHIIWQALGDVPNYIEPFLGSAAVLFLRPHTPKIETVNDVDGLLCNFWRSLQHDPDAVAEHADYPVIEQDLHARHLWLVGQRASITERLCADSNYYDAKAAGWWVWGLCSWIGGGWCSGEGPWVVGEDGLLEKKFEGGGISKSLPHLGNAGQGLYRKRPHLAGRGMGAGINRQVPHLGGDTGRGINRQVPHLGDTGRGECDCRREWLKNYLRGLADRLRNVRVCCGDWSRICGPSVTFLRGLTGVFCLHPDTRIRMADETLLPIESISPGSVVHGGRTVKKVWTRYHNGPMIHLQIQGLMEPIRVTPEHRIPRAPVRMGLRQETRSDNEIWEAVEIIEASKIQVGDLVLIPTGGDEIPVTWWFPHQRPRNRGTRQIDCSLRSTCDDSMGRILGLYAAEGCCPSLRGRPRRIQFTFGEKERDTLVAETVHLLEECFGVQSFLCDGRGSIHVVSGSVQLAEFFSHYIPGDAKSKTLHLSLMTAPYRLQRGLLRGWLDGDGGLEVASRNRVKLLGCTSSPKLADQLSQIAFRLGLRASRKARNKRLNSKDYGVIYDIYFAGHDSESLGYFVASGRTRWASTRRIINNHIFARVRAICRQQYSGIVYDLDVDGDDLVPAPWALIHNCDPPYSAEAGRGAGIYAYDDLSVAHAAREWAIDVGSRKDVRIVLAGYEGEYEMPAGWRAYKWQTHGGYGLQGKGHGRENRSRERLWLSPHCLAINRATQGNLF